MTQLPLFDNQTESSGKLPSTATGVISDIIDRLRAVNIVSFSGGKDSTTVLELVLAAMILVGDKNKRLYIVTSDTMMEIPYFQQYVDLVKKRLQAFIARSGVNAQVSTVHPEIKDSFWVSVLGKGYPAAHMGFRWCTGKMKIDPITKYTKEITAGHEYTVFVGVRSAESALRARIYRQKDYKPNHFAPILDWSANDVWEYLLTEPCPWGDHTDLVKVYRYSSDECVYGEKQGVCIGNARYGCWACPLQKSTQLDMIGMHTGDERYQELKRFKNLLSGMANNTAYRSRIRRNKTVGAGPFLVKIRKMLFAELKKVEAATGWQLITAEEEQIIKEHWMIDAEIHHLPDKTRPLLWEV